MLFESIMSSLSMDFIPVLVFTPVFAFVIGRYLSVLGVSQTWLQAKRGSTGTNGRTDSRFTTDFKNYETHQATSESPIISIIGRASWTQQDGILQNLFMSALRSAWRVIYYVYNWVYSTNHKRIAVNYFWFVILAGICGMILATIIRLEMAYPGIGVLAGDSLQYLSVVTAHAVIMVFFMIMPLLFGAFGNFLLPTQLGVHDVAFPRLNSAAFWFLPGGLLMLAQLVCLDRRYQRMNCFNIRELQTLLKNKHHPDLWDEYLTRQFLSQVTINTRFKTFGSDQISPKMSIFNAFPMRRDFMASQFVSRSQGGTLDYEGIRRYLKVWAINFVNSKIDDAMDWSFYLVVDMCALPFWQFEPCADTRAELLRPYSVDPRSIKSTYMSSDSFVTTNYLGAPEVAEAPRTLFYILTSDLRSALSGVVSSSSFSWLVDLGVLASPFVRVSQYYTSSELTAVADRTSGDTVSGDRLRSFETGRGVAVHSGHELASDYRFQKGASPVFKYDFKVGNYLPDVNKTLNQHLFTTMNDITSGVRKAPWMFSKEFHTFLRVDTLAYLAYFSTSYLDRGLRDSYLSWSATEIKDFKARGAYSAAASPTFGFYNFFSSLADNAYYVNARWVSLKALDQKFHNMYGSVSMQQRVFANWRQLKFTREAWRCKLLAARHQNTMYRRYIHEDSVVWAVERNAKDLLPGWAMITPFSARTRFTAIGKVDLGLMGVLLVLNSSIVSSANFLVTYRYLATLNNRKMRDARSFFTEAVMAASWMMIAANPMLVIGILMLLSDRHWQTSFFDYSGGGDTVLFQHMFWFFGHPEVYVIMIPTFGFNNTILSFYLRKRVSARASLLYSIYTIAFLGFFVWGHHMYMVGLAHTTRMLFSTLTVMISVPAATKLMHWCVTIVNSSITLELPLVFQFLFIFFFVSGGVSGMCVAHTGMDILFHDSFYVVGHFHVMLAGAAMFGSFGAFYFYFPSIFGVKFSRIFGYLHLVYYVLGQLMTVIPMFWLGYAGMPRRVLDYPASMGGWHAIVSAGHLLSVAGMMAFFVMIFDSIRHGRAATRSSFGVPRFNTRLNFYIYEGARAWFIQRKGWYSARTQIRNELDIDEIRYENYEILETTVFSYVLLNQRNERKERERN